MESTDVRIADPNRCFPTTQQIAVLHRRMWLMTTAMGCSCSHSCHVSDFHFGSECSIFKAWHDFGSCPVSICIKHKWPRQERRLLFSFPFLILSSLWNKAGLNLVIINMLCEAQNLILNLGIRSQRSVWLLKSNKLSDIGTRFVCLEHQHLFQYLKSFHYESRYHIDLLWVAFESHNSFQSHINIKWSSLLFRVNLIQLPSNLCPFMVLKHYNTCSITTQRSSCSQNPTY